MKCILHIGTEKTGTTLIQKWLYENRDKLSKQGIGLTTTGGWPNNRKLVAFFQRNVKRADDYMVKFGIQSDEDHAEHFKTFEDEFFAEIDALAKDHDTVILSSEHFHSRLRQPETVQHVKEFLSKKFDDIKVICYFREQSLVRTSLYSTALRAGNTKKIHDFHSSVGDLHHYYNYMEFFSKWEDVFGRDALIPKLYDRAAFADQDIRKDFMLSTLPEVDLAMLSFQTGSANESLSNVQAKLLRTLNEVMPRDRRAAKDPFRQTIVNKIQRTDSLKKTGKIRDDRQQEFFNSFIESNDAFFQHFFGAEKSLFERPTPQPPEDDENLIPDDALVDFMTNILQTEGITALLPREVDAINDLALRSYREGVIDRKEALQLVTISLRARPEGKRLQKMVEMLKQPVVAGEETENGEDE